MLRRSLASIVILVAAFATPAAGQVRPAPPPAGPDEIPAGWDLTDRDAILSRINAAARANTPGASEEIARVLVLGVEPSVAQAGLEALASLGRREGTPAVLRYIVHRRALLRRHAVIAARALGGPEIIRAVEARLSDPDADVRLEAARALATLGDAAGLQTLWRAVERDLALGMRRGGDSLTAVGLATLGARGTAADLERMTGLGGRVPLPILGPGIRAALHRADIAEDAKLRAIRAIAALSTQDARSLLESTADAYRGRPAAWPALARSAAARIQ